MKLSIEAERRLAAIESSRGLKAGGGDGTSGGVTDDWKAGVDRQLGQLHGDVRNLLYGLIGGFLILAGMIGGLYVRGDAKFEAFGANMSAAEIDRAKTEARIDAKLDLLLERKSAGDKPRP